MLGMKNRQLSIESRDVNSQSIANFRNDSGNYTGVDSTNIKVETNMQKMVSNRKVSKMLNGLGDDM